MSEQTAEDDLGRLFCDLVMKGGITSGVVYPSAISRLAQVYRLRSIGGASAGAIAAAGGAAAEYRRQNSSILNERMAGFDRLNDLAAELGQKNQTGHSRLFHLFLPSTAARPIFSILERMLNRDTKTGRLIWGVLGLLLAVPVPALIGLAFGTVAVFAAWTGKSAFPVPEFLAGVRPGVEAFAHQLVILFTVLSTVVLTVSLSLLVALRRFGKIMASQDFGLCTGMRAAQQSAEPPALTEWLYALFQDIAGKPLNAPLTFGDLRQIQFPETPGEDGIVLRMMTTCLTGGRPYTMPIEDASFYFDPAQLRRYFPKEVVDWMSDPARHRQDAADKGEEGANPLTTSAYAVPSNLLSLPVPDELPVILGVRMSLCFPILLSAIPLYRNALRKIPPKRPGDKPSWERYMEPVLFTDGGVCSNLPIHLFDAPLPAWPTFAINLRDDFNQSWETTDGRAVRPKRGQGFAGDRNSISTDPGLGSVISFLTAIVTTMQNWRDVLQRTAAGSRDRVVTVRHTREEGGLNLDMDSGAIKRMAESGELAADKLIAGFHPSPRPAQMNDDWTYHRWVRLRIQLRAMDAHLARLSGSVTSLHNQPTVSDLLNDPAPYVGNSYRMDKPDCAAAVVFLDDLASVQAKLAPPPGAFAKNSPRPASDLRVTPRF